MWRARRWMEESTVSLVRSQETSSTTTKNIVGERLYFKREVIGSLLMFHNTEYCSLSSSGWSKMTKYIFTAMLGWKQHKFKSFLLCAALASACCSVVVVALTMWPSCYCECGLLMEKMKQYSLRYWDPHCKLQHQVPEVSSWKKKYIFLLWEKSIGQVAT